MKYLKQAKALYLLTALFFCLTGLLLIVFPTLSMRIFCYIAGGVLIFYGLSKIVGYCAHDPYRLAFQFDLALGIFVILLGVLLLLHPGVVLSFVPLLIGIDIVVDGAFKLQTSVDAKRFGLSGWWIISLFALCSILLGALLIADPFQGGEALTMLMGIALLINGLQHFFNALYTVKSLRHTGRRNKTGL